MHSSNGKTDISPIRSFFLSFFIYFPHVVEWERHTYTLSLFLLQYETNTQNFININKAFSLCIHTIRVEFIPLGCVLAVPIRCHKIIMAKVALQHSKYTFNSLSVHGIKCDAMREMNSPRFIYLYPYFVR